MNLYVCLLLLTTLSARKVHIIHSMISGSGRFIFSLFFVSSNFLYFIFKL